MSVTLPVWHLEDFNQDDDPPEPAAPPVAAAEPEPAEPVLENAWTDGYMQATRHATAPPQADWPKSDLLAGLQEIEGRLKDSVEASACQLARLLLEAGAAFGRERWTAGLAERIQRMTELVRPALLSSVPEISIRSQDGAPILVAAAPGTVPQDAGTLALADSVTLSWKLGKAECGWTATLRDITTALAPLIADTIDPDTPPPTTDTAP
jgi:hypothetical protein